MPDEDDLAGAEVSPVAAFLCVFLWVDFMEPESLDFIESSDFMESPDFIESDEAAEELELPDFIESLLVCVGVALLSAFWAASCAKAEALITVQPASIARISFVLRMT
jgi:hypothetical protein